MHEQSETIQTPDGRWINVYGRATPQAGQQLPGTDAYGSMDEAVRAAKTRSDEAPLLPRLEQALVNADRAGDSRAAKILADEIRNARTLGATKLGGAYQPRTSLDPENPGPMERLGRGFTDFAVAGARHGLPKDQADQLTRDQDAEIAEYERGRKFGGEKGPDLLRFVGQNLPAMATSGGLAFSAERALGTKMLDTLPRMALGTAQGAVQGATTYTPDGQSKAIPVALGAASGALAPFLSDAVGSVVAKATQFGRQAAAKLAANPERIVAELQPVLEQQGVRWGDLSAEVQQNMVAQARRQMGVDGAMDAGAIARKAEMEEVLGPNAGPTRAQVTRNSGDWSWERNTQKLPLVGGDLTERFRAQLQRLQEATRDLVDNTGARAKNAYQAGASATDAVQEKVAASKMEMDRLYAAFRETGAGKTEVRPAPIADALGKVSEEYGTEHIPGAVRTRLNEFGLLEGKQTKLLTVDEAEKLRRLIGNNTDPRNAPQTAALGILKRAVDDAVKATDAPDIPALQTARRAAATHFAMKESSPGVTAAAEGAEPDKFFQKYVLNGNVADLRGLKATLNSNMKGEVAPTGMEDLVIGGQAWKDLKAQTLEHALKKAMSEGEGSFSGKAFRKALDEIGDERLKVIFDPKELAQIRKIDRTAYNVTAEPALSAVNHSNTASAGVQFLQDASRAAAPRLAEMATNIPFVGKIAAGAWKAGDDVARNAELRRRVASVLSGDVTDPQAQREALAALISGRIDPYVTSGVSGAAAYRSR